MLILQVTTIACLSINLVLVHEIGEGDSVPNKYWTIVDVRDTADALLLAYEKPEAEGRYICVAHHIRTKDLDEKVTSLYPNRSYLEK